MMGDVSVLRTLNSTEFQTLLRCLQIKVNFVLHKMEMLVSSIWLKGVGFHKTFINVKKNAQIKMSGDVLLPLQQK
jgi:hypothetical protein